MESVKNVLVDIFNFPAKFLKKDFWKHKILMSNSFLTVLAEKPDGEIVGVFQPPNVMAITFHPELTDDMRFHNFFIDLILSTQ